MKILSALFGSKKFIVFAVGTIGTILTAFADMAPEEASALADRIVTTTVAYLGAQGLVDTALGIKGDGTVKGGVWVAAHNVKPVEPLVEDLSHSTAKKRITVQDLAGPKAAPQVKDEVTKVDAPTLPEV